MIWEYNEWVFTLVGFSEWKMKADEETGELTMADDFYRIVEEKKKASIILKFRASPFIIDIDFCFDWLDMGSRARDTFIIHNGVRSLAKTA